VPPSRGVTANFPNAKDLPYVRVEWKLYALTMKNEERNVCQFSCQLLGHY
jgi:hypothetical protein